MARKKIDCEMMGVSRSCCLCGPDSLGGVSQFVCNVHNIPPQARHILSESRIWMCLHGNSAFMRMSVGFAILGM